MGLNLSKEVEDYLSELGVKVERISFIGHSLGGVIIRSAMHTMFMISNRDKLFMFISLSSPHLGYLTSKSGLVDTGMWLI